MSNNHRLPVHVGDYMKDTPAFSRHSWEHHGIYFAALMIAWNTPRGRLPNDPRWLSLRFGCTIEEYETHVLPVLLSYFKNDGNFFTQKRLVSELNRVRKIARSQTERRKAMKDNENKPKTKPTRTGDGFVPPTPTPTPVSKDTDSPPLVPPKGKTKRGSRLSDEFGSNGSTPPIPEDYEEAARGIGVRAAEQWPIFYDYWISQPGHKGVKADWLATWRNWCRKSVEYGGSRAPPAKLGRISAAIYSLKDDDDDERLNNTGMASGGCGTDADPSAGEGLDRPQRRDVPRLWHDGRGND